MRLRRVIKYSSVLILLFTLSMPEKGFFVNAGTNTGEILLLQTLPEIRDTVRTDTTGKLPFPFKDQPAFGFPERQDTSGGV
jgi:hypothetical protein